MEIVCTELVKVIDTTSVGQVRRAARAAAVRLRFDETGSGELALLATEMTSNVLAHGGGGDVVILGLKYDDNSFARILTLDRGPGIQDVALALTDGFSTNGTPGGGLGALKRIASRMEIFTGRTGTIVLVELGKLPEASDVQIAGIAVPYPGEIMCGDAW